VEAVCSTAAAAGAIRVKTSFQLGYYDTAFQDLPIVEPF